MSFRRVGIHWNSTKDSGLEAARTAIRVLMGCGVEAVVGRALASKLPEMGLKGCDEALGTCDLLLVLGGDGTILQALDVAILNDIPILGVNLGRLGFLCEVEANCLAEDLLTVLRGEYSIEERMLMGIEGEDENTVFALNEVVIDRSSPEVRILSLEYFANGVSVNRIAGDGLIISTATGSTAYSLSAGGPVVAPGLDCFVVTPICAHMLNVRPVVLSASDEITVRLTDDRLSARAVLDGWKILPLCREERDCITIRRSSRRARFIRLHDRNYFDLLRGKLSEWTH